MSARNKVLFVTLATIILASSCTDRMRKEARRYYDEPFREPNSVLMEISDADVPESLLGIPVSADRAANGNFSLQYNWGSLIYRRTSGGTWKLAMMSVEQENRFVSFPFDGVLTKDDIVRMLGKPTEDHGDLVSYRLSDKELGVMAFKFENRGLAAVIYSFSD